MNIQLKQKIIDAIMYIDQYCKLIMLGKYDLTDRYILVLTTSFSTLIPEIIKTYNEYELLKNEDSYVWVKLLGRILEALSSDDDFRKVDVLMIEMRQQLTRYMEYMEQE